MLEGTIPYIESNRNSEIESMNYLKNKAMKTINMPVFVTLITAIEEFGRVTGKQLTLIHDKTKQLESGYNQMFDWFSNSMEKGCFTLTDGNKIFLGFDYLRESKFIDSKESRWIQCADLLVSLVGRILKNIVRGESLDVYLYRIMKMIFPCLFAPYALGGIICSDETYEMIVNHCFS